MNYDGLSDNELLLILSKKDRNSESVFRLIYQKQGPKIMSYCRNILRNNTIAEEVFQETFIKFYQSAKPQNCIVSIGGYLTRIARNLCFDYFRNKNNMVPIEELNIDISDINSFEDFNEEDFEKRVQMIISAMELISSEDKELIVLRVINQMQYSEIAEIFNTTESNARKKVFRAKIKLKKIIEQYNPILKNY